ncbi:hypothetical protein ACTXT7_001917 [Hymenolepis weldensis]
MNLPLQLIRSGTVITLTPLPKLLSYTSNIREKGNSQKDVSSSEYRERFEVKVYDLPKNRFVSVAACVEQTTCSDCLGDKVKSFQCQWCPQIQACSSGVDRGWQRWRDNDCHLNKAFEHIEL